MLDEKSLSEGVVNEVQSLEGNIFKMLVDKIEKVFKGASVDEERFNINVNIQKEVKSTLDNLDKETTNALKANAASTLNEFKKGKKPEVDFGDIKKEVVDDYKNYINSKGTNFVIGKNQKIPQWFTTFIDSEVKEVVEGSEYIQTILNKAIKELASTGLRVINYDSGVVRNIDVYVRQQILYAQKKSTQDIRDRFAKENGITIFEFDAHPNARPSHQVWQGKRYDITGKYYPTLEQLTHGEHNDYGCKHRAFPVWDKDDKYMFTKEQLDNINTKPFQWKGKEVDGYEGTQLMREYERKMRAINREMSLLKSKKMDIPDELNFKFNKLDKEYGKLCKKMNTYKRTNRLTVNY